MKVKDLAALAALPVAVLSIADANAGTDRDAIQACSQAIVATIEERQGAGVGLLVDESGIDPSKELVSQTTMFDIDALDASTDKVIGRFRCHVNRSAEVTRLRTLALDIRAAKREDRS